MVTQSSRRTLSRASRLFSVNSQFRMVALSLVKFAFPFRPDFGSFLPQAMGKRIMIVVVALAAIVAAPILMRRDTALGEAGHADDRLVVITPHNQTIRAEFGEAFAEWWKKRTGRSVYVDWRTPGGTSEIRRVLDSGFEAAEEGGRAGVGIDVFFGGGDYEFRKQAKLGRLAKLEVFEKHPDWFDPSVIPESFTGERYYDTKDHEWVGVCLSQFGICYNRDGLKRLGLPKPKQWADLADPKYFGQVALADPTKSGSVTRAFEMILQQQMQEAVDNAPATKEPGPGSQVLLEQGWERGIRLLQEIGANARYFTDSAVKIPMDVASGDAAAGMCIDFYGRAYNERLKKPDGTSRLEWTAPENGTSVSVDPVAVLRGAPHPEVAQAFVEFLLSKPGQFLWNARPGCPGGPKSRALRRLPIRKDLYSREYRRYFTDPDALPYLRSGGFVYRGELTGRAFGAIGLIVRAMCIDSHQELKAAWAAANSPGAPPEAKRILGDVSAVSYRKVMDEIVPLMKRHDPLATARFASELGEGFREQYRRVVEMVKSKQSSETAFRDCLKDLQTRAHRQPQHIHLKSTPKPTP